MVLYLTSLVLGTNAIHAFTTNHFVYSMAFTGHTIVSVLYHTSSKSNSIYDRMLFWTDQLFVHITAITGFYYFLQIKLLNQIAAAISIVLCIYYYKYGYYTNQFCWDPTLGILYHGSMHMIGSLGHHAIILGLTE